MILFSWSDPKYFDFLSALVKSVRYSGNEHRFILHLMDFNEEQKEKAQQRFKNDSKLEFWFTHHEDFGYDISNKFEYYRNCRPRYFLKLLDEFQKPICTFGANGLVFTKLDYIQKHLETNDFVFMERTKKNVWTDDVSHVRNIHELNFLVKRHNLDIDKVLETTTGKVVLLGTHAFQNNEMVRKVIERWKDDIENPKRLGKTYSDMNLFVRSLINISEEAGYNFKRETGWDLPREDNPFCDTLFTTNKIWFAKGPSKFNNKVYKEKVKFFLDWEYKL